MEPLSLSLTLNVYVGMSDNPTYIAVLECTQMLEKWFFLKFSSIIYELLLCSLVMMC